MNKTYIGALLCSLAIVGCLCYWGLSFSNRGISTEEKLLKEMEVISNKVDSIKRANDSLKVIIDTTEVEIEHVYENYIQVREHIITQSIDSDCVFFSNYLSEDNRRFIDTIDFKTIETY